MKWSERKPSEWEMEEWKRSDPSELQPPPKDLFYLVLGVLILWILVGVALHC